VRLALHKRQGANTQSVSAEFQNPTSGPGGSATAAHDLAIEGLPPIARLIEVVRDPALGSDREAAAAVSQTVGKRFPWWTPSMSDLFLVAFFIWTFLAGSSGWAGLLADADSGWHIRTGEVILQTHTVPQKDLYSFSKPAADWYAWEWLTDIIWAKLHGAFGLRGICWFAGVLIIAFLALLLRFSLWMGASLFISLATALIAAGASSVHFLARPHIFTLALLPLSVWLIEADRRRPSHRVFLMVPLVGLWANLHGGFPAVLLVLGAAAAGSAIEVLIGASGVTWNRAIRYAALTAAGACASLANPYGYRLHQHMIEYLRSNWIRTVVEEFHSPSFNNENMFQFEVLLFLGLMAAASLIQRKRVTEVLWILGFGHMALSSVRHVTIYSAVTAPYIAVELTRWWNYAFGGASKKSIAGIWNQIAADLTPSFNRTTFWLPVVLTGALFLPASMAHWPSDYPKEMFPVDLIHKRQQLLAHSRLLTTDQWGDYLIYLNYPEQRVFVDGRSDFYGPEIGNQYLQLLQGQYQWKTLLAKHRFDHVMAPLDWPLASLLKSDPDWKLLDDTGKVVLFERARNSHD
jgi:hypothetical protein